MESNKWCKVGEAKQSSQDKWQENAVCDLDFEGRSRKWTKKKKKNNTPPSLCLMFQFSKPVGLKIELEPLGELVNHRFLSSTPECLI